ncbi:MAG: DUF3943 domain-containing protein [Dysgonomonas sp.]
MPKQVTKIQYPDSLDIKHYSKKHFWRASSEVVGLNSGVWAFDRYVTKSDFAYISKETIKANFSHGFVWDNDQIGTNLFLHPYHGSLYYNAARSNGYGYLASSMFAFGGSLMWEMFCENEYPSINDIIATPIGGTAFGEISYRASDMILDDRKTGAERLGREAAALLIAPTRGLTRILNGDAWKKRRTSGRQFGIPPISVEISTGVRGLELKDEILDEGVGLATGLSVEYGERYESHGLSPYDYFVVRGNLNIQKGQPMLGSVSVLGRLWSSDLIDSKKDYFNIGIYQHFDYYDSDTISDVSNKIPYKFGTPASFGVGLIHKSKRFANWDFNSFIHFNGVLIGGSLSDHYLVDKRDYNLGSGFSWHSGVSIAYKDIAALAWKHVGFRLFSWKGYPQDFNLESAMESEINYQGDKSNTTLNTSNVRFDLKLRRQLYLTSEYSIYRRSTHYAYFDDVYSWSSEGKLQLTYKF